MICIDFCVIYKYRVKQLMVLERTVAAASDFKNCMMLNCENQPSGSWNEDFQSVFTIYGHGSYLGHVTSIILINFPFLGHIFINSISFRSQAAIVFEKSTFFTFSNRKD